MEAPPLSIYLNIVQILISIALIVLTVMQRSGGGLGSLGGDSSIYHTRRGMEKSLHNLTIVLAVVFGLTSLLSVIFQ
jgi:preprotein translocase subunit SecG